MMRLVTFLAGTAFLALMGAVMFGLAGTLALPSIWIYLSLRVLFTAASVLAMPEETARERLKPGKGARPEPLYNIGATLAWLTHLALVIIDLGYTHWSAGFPWWVQAIGILGTLAGYGWVIWALRHNEYLSARIRIQHDRGQHVISSGPYAIIRHPNNAGAALFGLTSGLVFTSWPSILPMLIWVGLVMVRTLNEEKVLMAELEGYRDYAEKVRYRFVPGLW